MYQDSVLFSIHFSLIQLKPRGVSILIFCQNPASTFRRVDITFKKCLLFYPVVPCMKKYRLITDPAETRRALFCFLKVTQLASCPLSKCGDITEAEQMLGKERAFMAICELDYLPETWTFIWKILASGKVVPVHLLGRL